MSYNILLVDDDEDFRFEFRSVFENYNVIEAGSGEEALKILKKANEIDLVVLDITLPGQKGTKILKEIKETNPSLGVVIITGHSSKDSAIEALKAKADDYIEKPLNIQKTAEIIKVLLDKKGITSSLESIDIKDKIDRVKLFAEKNVDKKISLEEAAALIYLSPKYFSRVFKEISGVGFNDYKLDVKLKKAKELLSASGYNIDEIAYKIGYENPESFIRIFKKNTSFTPTEYRNKIKNG